MHERSLMLALLKRVAFIQADHGGAMVDEIAVEVGPLSGVEPLLLQTALAEFAESFPGATLVINEVPITAICQDCGEMTTMERFLSRCSSCQSPDLQISGGDTFRLLHVTLKESSRG